MTDMFNFRSEDWRMNSVRKTIKKFCTQNGIEPPRYSFPIGELEKEMSHRREIVAAFSTSTRHEDKLKDLVRRVLIDLVCEAVGSLRKE